MKSISGMIRTIGTMLVALTMLTLAACSSSPEIDEGVGTPGPVMLEQVDSSNTYVILATYKDDVTSLCYVDQANIDALIKNINAISTQKEKSSELKKFSQPAYAIQARSKDGKLISISYSNGLWVTDDGVYSGDGIDFESLVNTSSVLGIYDDTMNFPTANIICKYNKNFYTEYEDFTAMDGLDITLGDYSNGKINVTIENNTHGNITGAGFDEDLCIRVDGKWCYIPYKNSKAYLQGASIFAKGQSMSFDLETDIFYGELEPGDYRMIISKLSVDYDKTPIGYADFKVD